MNDDYDTGDTRTCPGCGTTLEHGGYAPSGDPEWYHVESLTDIDCPSVL